MGNSYLLSKQSDPLFYQVYEKLPAGGFGRLLRYRGMSEDARWIDLEFVYQDQHRSLTILDYGSGRFFRVTFNEKLPESSCLFPSEDGKGLNKDLCSAPSYSQKWVLSGQAVPGWALPEIHRILSESTARTEKENWSSRLVRGPPGEEITR